MSRLLYGRLFAHGRLSGIVSTHFLQNWMLEQCEGLQSGLGIFLETVSDELFSPFVQSFHRSLNGLLLDGGTWVAIAIAQHVQVEHLRGREGTGHERRREEERRGEGRAGEGRRRRTLALKNQSPMHQGMDMLTLCLHELEREQMVLSQIHSSARTYLQCTNSKSIDVS